MWRTVVVAAAAVAAALGVAPRASADVYEFRSDHGVRVFTNVPTQEARPAHLPQLTIVPAPVLTFASVRGAGGVDRTPYDTMIREIADRYAVDYALVKAMIKAESAFDARAVSSKGALGLMQLMPATAADYQVRDVFTPRDNIEGGVRHLRMLLDRYGDYRLAVAAYNAGQARVDEAGGIPAIPETVQYLERVARYRQGYLREGLRGGFRR
jgi:soluble lytic murein transglycosylase-like protein